ncbi:hypothetical protein EV421DRAFT_1801001 [Armillaria borealis]|uniref:Uncharacterized protein n=1 Tax=Armillaria borealis TaxID=47425 RepID=A0AA39JKI8_9AGAR|nr:hypothetical protein EV421DRAFT_1801001 [Armillaria borealis]
MSYYRGTNCPQAYIPGPSPANHHDTYWRMAHGSYPTPPPIPARLSEENLARLDRWTGKIIHLYVADLWHQSPVPILPTIIQIFDWPFISPLKIRHLCIHRQVPILQTRDGLQHLQLVPIALPVHQLSRIHSPFPLLLLRLPRTFPPTRKGILDANAPPRPRFSPSHNYPDPRPLVHRSPAYQQPTHFDNGNRNPYYDRTRFPPNNVPGAFSHLQNPRYTPRGEFESDEEDSDSDESGDSEFSTGSSLTSGSEFFEEDSYDGDYEDAAIYESPGDAATL